MTSAHTSLDTALSVFISVQPRLFGIAYRMLGSAADAEDIVQSVWLRWQITDRSAVVDPPAFLATATSRMALNLAQSARARREKYVGPWLPEPVETSSDPNLGAERGEALELAVLMLLEKLSPQERAAYVLREAFNYPYQHIADIIQLEVANVRQLVSRARKHIASGRRASATGAEQTRLLTAFIAAARDGDRAAMESLFASDVTSYSDGGGVVRAARRPVAGSAIVAKFVAKVTVQFWNGVDLEHIQVNGQEAIAILRGGVLVALVAIGASKQGIDQIMWIMRPSKLAAISRSLQASRAR
jgi:RNA polymerase sigma-70 factor (ECF subfamily)